MEENRKAFLEHMRKHGKNASWKNLAEAFGFESGEAARGFNRRNKKKTNQVELKPTVVVEKQESTTVIDSEKNTATITSNSPITTADAVLDYCKLSPDEWEVKEIWSKEKQTKELNHPLSIDGVLHLYETTAKLLPKTPLKDFKKDFKDFVDGYIFNPPKRNLKEKIKSSNILIISLTDLHLDKKSYFSETGEHGDMDLSSSRAMNACVDLVERAIYAHDDLKKIIILGGHDYFHANTAANTTEKGTKLDVDGRWHESFKKGLTLMTSIIDFCLEHAPVDYYNVIGNHGPERDTYLAIALEAFYRNDSNVFIETIYNYRKYFQYGRSAFMLTHEVGKKLNELPLIFATEQPELFARCKYRTVLCGHLHKQHETQFVGTNENFGIVYKIMPSLSSSDQWHHKNGYIGNQKSCIALVVNEDYGTIAELIYQE